MAKNKNADAKSSKAKKIKIPKQIAGVTIPKTLRDSGKAAVKLAQNPVARELLSAGLAAAAAAIAANSRTRKATADGGREAANAVGEAAASASDSAAKIGAALVSAAGDAAQRFFGLDGEVAKSDAGASAGDAVVQEPPVKAAQPRKAASAASEPMAEFPIPPNGRA